MSPPIIGAAMRFITSDPADVEIMIGRRPPTAAAIVMSLGRTRRTAPCTSASSSSSIVPRRPSRRAFWQDRSRNTSMKTPISASRPSKAMVPTQAAAEML